MGAMNKQAKPITAWVVEACSGRGNRWLISSTMSARRTDALSKFMAIWEQGPSARWDYWRRKGYRLVRCTLIAGDVM